MHRWTCNIVYFRNLFYKFEQGHNITESTKNIYRAKGKGVVDHSIVTRWLKKFSSGCKNLDNQARSSRPKNVDAEAALLAIEINLLSSTERVSGNLRISQSSLFHHFHNLDKSIQKFQIMQLKYCKTFDSP